MDEMNSFKVSKGYSVYMLILFSAAFTIDMADRLILGAILPAIQHDWGLSDAQAGMLNSILLFFMVFAAPFVGLLIDRWSRRKTISLMVFVWSLASLASGFTRSFWQLFSCRGILGLGESGYGVGSATMATSAFSNERRGLAQSIILAGIPIGSALGLMLGGILGQKYGWRAAVGIMSIAGFPLALLIWFLKDYKSLHFSGGRQASDQGGKRAGLGRIIGQHILKTPSLVYNNLAAGMAGFCAFGIVYWLPSYYVRYHHMNMKAAGISASMLALLGIIMSPLGGLFADWLYKKKRALRQAFCGMSLVLAALGIFLGLGSQQTSACILWFMLGGLGISLYIGPSAAVVQSVVHPGMRGAAHGVYMTSTLLFGGAWSSVVVGFLSDKMGGLDKAMYFLIAAALLSALFYFIGSRYYEKDEDRFREVQLVDEELKA